MYFIMYENEKYDKCVLTQGYFIYLVTQRPFYVYRRLEKLARKTRNMSLLETGIGIITILTCIVNCYGTEAKRPNIVFIVADDLGEYTFFLTKTLYVSQCYINNSPMHCGIYSKI